MTSSSTRPPAVPPPAPVVRMGDPGELLAALPFLVGFRPRDSLVLVGFGGASGRRVGLSLVFNLPALGRAGSCWCCGVSPGQDAATA